MRMSLSKMDNRLINNYLAEISLGRNLPQDGASSMLIIIQGVFVSSKAPINLCIVDSFVDRFE